MGKKMRKKGRQEEVRQGSFQEKGKWCNAKEELTGVKKQKQVKQREEKRQEEVRIRWRDWWEDEQCRRESQERRWGVSRGKRGISVVLGGSVWCCFDVSRKNTHTHLYIVAQPAEGCDLWIQKQQAEKTTETQTGSHSSESLLPQRERESDGESIREDHHLSHTLFFTCSRWGLTSCLMFHSSSCFCLLHLYIYKRRRDRRKIRTDEEQNIYKQDKVRMRQTIVRDRVEMMERI